LAVLGKSVRFLASEMQPVALSLWFVSLSAMRKRNEHTHAARPTQEQKKVHPSNLRDALRKKYLKTKYSKRN
jgi:hypothetical protein